MKYGFSKVIDRSYEDTIERVTEELKKEGFGVLTSIDMKETIKKKLNMDFPKYAILGVCNPPFAYQALEADKEIGLMLPCNLIIYQNNGKTTVAALDPTVITKITENPAINSVAEEMKIRLERVVAAV